MTNRTMPCRCRLCALLVLLILLTACSSGLRSDFALTLVHLNDTHSHLEPLAVNLALGGEKTAVELGGFARLKTVLDQYRSEDPHLLLLHGGDAVQGTLYFTLFNGEPEFDFLNLLGVDAMTFGNHEFDRGTAPLPDWIKRSRFPWLSANIDFSQEPAIAVLVKPYLLKQVNGEQVAIIGVTTETTPQSTLNVGKALFRDAVASVRQQVTELTARGINKIILLSHLGYQQDQELAAQVSGLDVIVGGHSHSLLGDGPQLAALGLTPAGPYPTEQRGVDGKRVLVLQAWRWGHLLGKLQLRFTPEGEIAGYDARVTIPMSERLSRNGVPVLPETAACQDIRTALAQSGIVRVVAEDPAVVALLAPYARRVREYRRVTVATATEPLEIGLNSGPGPLVADSMLAAVPGARAALLNYGGVRRGLATGTISMGDLLEVLPFNNTLVVLDLTGAELQQALEEGVAFLTAKYGPQASEALPFVAGMRFSVQHNAARGVRVSGLQIKDADGQYQQVQPAVVYRVVTNAFVAGGGDGFAVIRNGSGFRNDTGIIDSDAFREYLQRQGTVANPAEQRITLLQ